MFIECHISKRRESNKTSHYCYIRTSTAKYWILNSLSFYIRIRIISINSIWNIKIYVNTNTTEFIDLHIYYYSFSRAKRTTERNRNFPISLAGHNTNRLYSNVRQNKIFEFIQYVSMKQGTYFTFLSVFKNVLLSTKHSCIFYIFVSFKHGIF